MNEEELRRTLELSQYFVALPAFKSIYESIDYTYDDIVNIGVDRPYNSSLEDRMTRSQLADYLVSHHLL